MWYVGWVKERSDVPIKSIRMMGTLRFTHPTMSVHRHKRTLTGILLKYACFQMNKGIA